MSLDLKFLKKITNLTWISSILVFLLFQTSNWSFSKPRRSWADGLDSWKELAELFHKKSSIFWKCDVDFSYFGLFTWDFQKAVQEFHISCHRDLPRVQSDRLSASARITINLKFSWKDQNRRNPHHIFEKLMKLLIEFFLRVQSICSTPSRLGVMLENDQFEVWIIKRSK